MDRVRIAVSLVKSADGTKVWSQTYEKELKDIFALQSEIAAAVAKEMQVTLLEGKSGTFADDAGSQIASIYALRKGPDRVFEWLERAWLNHDPGLSEIMGRSFHPHLQRRSPLHSFRPEDRHHAEDFRKLVNARVGAVSA